MKELCAKLKFARDLTILLNTFYDLLLLYNQDIQVVNFSKVDLGIVNVIITYNTKEGQSVKLEGLGKVKDDYERT